MAQKGEGEGDPLVSVEDEADEDVKPSTAGPESAETERMAREFLFQQKISELLSNAAQKETEIQHLRRTVKEQKGRLGKSADLKPMKFNGKADLEDYLKQFEAISRFNQWEDRQRAVILMSKLEGEALTAAAVLENPTFDEIVQQLRRIFSPQLQEIAALKLKSRRQESGETLESLSTDVYRLTLKTYPAFDQDVRERIAKDCFTEAIADQRLREKLRDKNLKTLQESVTEARRLQTNLEMEAARVKEARPTVRQTVDRESTDSNSLQEEVRRMRSEIAALKKRESRKKEKSSSSRARAVTEQRRPVKCYKCTLEGHMAKNCPYSDEVISGWLRDGRITVPRFFKKENGTGRSKNGPSTTQ